MPTSMLVEEVARRMCSRMGIPFLLSYLETPFLDKAYYLGLSGEVAINFIAGKVADAALIVEARERRSLNKLPILLIYINLDMYNTRKYSITQNNELYEQVHKIDDTFFGLGGLTSEQVGIFLELQRQEEAGEVGCKAMEDTHYYAKVVVCYQAP